MRTVIVSDLHLGAGHGSDLVRLPLFRERLLAELVGADQVVLLGDIVELRDTPIREALGAAAPFFELLGKVAAKARIVIVPGNHDHHLVAPWLDRRRTGARAAPKLELEHVGKPTAGPVAKLARIATAAGAGEVTLAYPGLWIGDGVYVTHGHYVDLHLTVPTFERLGVGVVQRFLGGLPDGRRVPDDYERVQAPLYAFLYEMAQAGDENRPAGTNPSVRMWMAMTGASGPAARVRSLLLGSVALPGAVRAANRLGLGRFSTDLSLAEISRAGITATRELVESLDIDADHVVVGHTHRRGPLASDGVWRAGTVHLHNTGSWVWSPLLVGTRGSTSPYWPGTIAVIDGDEPPELRHLLDDLEQAEIQAAVKGEAG